MLYLELLQRIVFVTSSINELTLVFNPWIISDSNAPEYDRSKAEGYVASPWTASIMYGMLEPLYTVLLRRIPVPPFMMVMGLGMLSMLIRSELPEHRRSPKSAAIVVDSGKEVPYGANHLDPTKRPEDGSIPESGAGWLQDALLRTFPVHIAAATNASLLNFGQALSIPPDGGSRTTISIVGTATWIYYLMFRLRDHHISWVAYRPHYIGQNGLKAISAQLMRLATLLIVRTMLRLVLGLPSLGSMERMSEQQAVELFGPQRYEHIVHAVQRLPPWLSPVMGVLGIVGMVVTRVYFPPEQSTPRASQTSGANRSNE